MAELTFCIALCTYNGSAYLRQQLASILAQTRLPDRMVAVDDGSVDATLAILYEFARQAPFPVAVHSNPQNLGYLRNFERAIELCEGEVIVLCDQDDVWHRQKLAAMEGVFRRSPQTALVFTDAEAVDAQLRPLGYRLWEAVHFTPTRQARFAWGQGFEVLLQGNVVTGAAMCFRSRYRDLVLPMVEEVVHDAWIALLISAVAPVAPLPAPLLRYRQHGSNQLGVKKHTLPQRISRARQVRVHPFERLCYQHQQALERLRSRTEIPTERLEAFERAIAHFSLRCRLPERRLQRLSPILRELTSGGYSRMANGLSSAVRDLVV